MAILDTAMAWGPFLLALAASAAVALTFYRLTRRFVSRLVRKTPTQVDDLLLRPLQPAVYLLVFALSLWLLVHFLQILVPAVLNPHIPRVGLILGVLILAPVLARLFAGGLKQAARRGYRWERVALIGGRIGNVVVWVLAILVILGSFGISITPLLASLGLATVVIALALQETLANFFAGLWIETEHALKPGHYVRVEDAQVEGWIQEVGWRTTRIRTIESNYVVIPNSKLSQSVVTDYHLPVAQSGVRLPIIIGFETDVEKFRRVVLDEVRKPPAVTGVVDQDVHELWFMRYAEYGMEFVLLVQLVDYPSHYRALTEVRARILNRLRTEGIRIPIPVRENVNITSEAPRTILHADIAKKPEP